MANEPAIDFKSPSVLLVIGILVVPLNYALLQTIPGGSHAPPGLVGICFFSCVQVAAGIACGIGGARRWKAARKPGDLLLSIAGWIVALVGLGELAFGALFFMLSQPGARLYV